MQPRGIFRGENSRSLSVYNFLGDILSFYHSRKVYFRFCGECRHTCQTTLNFIFFYLCSSLL